MEAIIHFFIRVFGWSIVHSLWQGAIIYTLLFLILNLFPRLSPSAKHNLSYLSVSAIFTWFVATIIRLWQIPVQNPAISFLHVENEYALITSDGWSLAGIEGLFPVIITFYIGGLLVQSFILYKGYRILQNLRKTNLEEVPAHWLQIYYKLIAKLNINKKVAFHISGIASVPMAVGYFKPVILFPASLATSLDSEQVEAILIHELTHIRRNDYLFNLVKTFIDTVMFFNPFIWLTGRFIRIEREHICDDMVLKYTGQPLKYAETLLQIEMEKTKSFPAIAMAAVNKKQYLLNRIKRMTNMKTNSMNLRQQLAGVTVLIAAVFCLAWLAPSQTKKNKTEMNVSELSSKTPVKAFSKSVENSEENNDTIIPKKKPDVKIIVTDKDGKTKEYNSIKELPDSLKLTMDNFPGGNFSFIADSLRMNLKTLRDQFNDTAFLRGQREIAVQFNSPEFKENLKEVFKSFNSPGFKKEMEELKLQLKSGEFRKQQEEIMKNLNSAEFKKQQAELKKLSAELKTQLNSKEFKEAQKELILSLHSNALSKLPNLVLQGSDYTISGVDTLFFSGGDKGKYRIFMDSPQYKKEKELQNNRQYQKLKKKFEKDVEKLRKKQAESELSRK